MPRPRRINVRLLMFLCAVALPLVWYGYVLADQLIYHGIKPHNGYTEVDLRTLGCFAFNANTDGIGQVPARFRALDGQRIILQGVMYNLNVSRDKVKRFQFVYNIQTCCLGGPPKVQERVFAYCKPGEEVTYYDNRPVNLTGILHVKIERDLEYHTVLAVYELQVESVDPM
ncbi:MAG TPA: hypothetical protein VFE47_32240 [Tepidisphaeraceae bacterium]|jgi:hypothetical protein|nr:hypothetical protein [Tepidisphaeraceae bacterium]